METPDIAKADDLFTWIAAAVDAWIAVEEGRSQRQFAVVAGVPRGTLSNVLKGQRPLPPEHIAAVAGVLQLDEAERAVLVDLVAATRAGASEHDVLRLRGRQALLLAHRPSARDAAYMASHTTVRVRELSVLPGFEADPAWIAARLVPPVSEAEAAEALRVLAEVHPRIGREHVDVSSGAEPPWRPSPDYQHQVLAAAQHAVGLPRDQRYLQSWVEAVPEEALPLLRAELDALVHRVVAVCRAAGGPPTRLVQVSAQLVPLSAEPCARGDDVAP